ncbi:TPA: hypothetical protein DF272_00520 [Candidatus Falkowbacteria bacterium]|nr:hypothetical protein [Candidatus Falkowbacteria bacterium]
MVAPVAFAQLDITGNLANTGEGIYGPGGAPANDLPVIIGNIINVVLGFLGVVLVLIVIYGGFKYMTSGGEDKGAKEGKQWIINGIIGLVIVLSAYAITTFVVSRLATATGTTVQ